MKSRGNLDTISPLANHASLVFCAENFLVLLCRTPLRTHLNLTYKSEGVYTLQLNALFPMDNSEVHSTPKIHGGLVSQLHTVKLKYILA